MYLEHFGLNEFPFALTPNTNFFCNLISHQEALNVALVAIQNSEGFVKIIGEVGTGKTIICRNLLNKLDSDKKFVTAYIANPNLDSSGLYQTLANEIGVNIKRKKIQTYEVLQLLTDKLLEIYKAGQRVVIIIDEAQVLPDETLEALRLLSNIETEAKKLLHIILFGQPELDERLKQPNLRQLQQRIIFSYCLRPLQRNELNDYVNYRLKVAGHNSYGSLFSNKICSLLFKASNGIPRIINILCHKSMLVAYSYGKKNVTLKSMLLAIKDTDSATSIVKRYITYSILFSLLVIEIGVIAYFVLGIY